MHRSIVWYKASPSERDATGAVLLPRSLAHMHPRDETILFLHIAAEVEHSLLVQYLYAAYSLLPSSAVSDPTRQALLDKWIPDIHGVARQEMGHLATVQNLLWALGGPIAFEREDFPFRTGLYPFHFRLERLSRDSLAKYVVAEMPPLSTLPSQLRHYLRPIRRRAAAANLGATLNRVGALYARLQLLVHGLGDEDFRFDTVSRWQALPDDFSFSPPTDPNVLSQAFICPIGSQSDALNALELIANQGEGPSGHIAGSHFDTFLSIYRDFPETDPRRVTPTWIPSSFVPTDPVISAHVPRILRSDINRITAEPSRSVAQLADLRYRMALSLLSLYFHIDATKCANIRKDVARWIKQEMRDALGVLGGFLPTLPRHSPDTVIYGERAVAAAPFDLPYTLQLPHRSSDQWRLVESLICATRRLCDHIRQGNIDDALSNVLSNIEKLDAGRLPTVQQMTSTDQC